MNEKEQSERLNEIVDRLLGREKQPQLIPDWPSLPFDTSRPNIHDSKKEFLRELAVVESIVNNLESVLEQVEVPEGQASTETDEMFKRLRTAIEVAAIQRKHSMAISKPGDLAVKNIYDTGFVAGSMHVVAEMYFIYSQRLIELRDQEKQFWIVSNRPPNYYARTVALRLARLYARETGKFPTYGTSREGNFPSTDFGRALEEIFKILKIRASVQNAAKWALGQLTEDDLAPQKNALLGFMGIRPGGG